MKQADQIYDIQYDKMSPQSIELFAQRLDKRTLEEVEGIKKIPGEILDVVPEKRSKGVLGTAVEEFYFGISPGNSSEPDFKEARVELKTTPVKQNKDKTFSAKERLSLGMIDYVKEADRTYKESSFYKKNEKLLLMRYLHIPQAQIRNTHFLSSKLYDLNLLPEEDKKIIREDWERINHKLKNGLAHELSEGDTYYLSACTKSSSSETRRRQKHGELAKPRAYSFKQGYMTTLFRREVKKNDDYERVLKKVEESGEKTFEEYVLDRFKPYLGKKIDDIQKILDLDVKSGAKNRMPVIARKIMGVRKKYVEEFESAGILMKTIQVKSNGTPAQAMSFPAFKHAEVIDEQWESEDDSEMANFRKIIDSRFLFIIIGCEKDCESNEKKILKEVRFWSMSESDKEIVKEAWEDNIKRIREGRFGEMVKASDERIMHVRPKGTKQNGFETAHNGESVRKKCFWLNAQYIKNELQKMKVIE